MGEEARETEAERLRSGEGEAGMGAKPLIEEEDKLLN